MLEPVDAGHPHSQRVLQAAVELLYHPVGLGVIRSCETHLDPQLVSQGVLNRRAKLPSSAGGDLMSQWRYDLVAPFSNENDDVQIFVASLGLFSKGCVSAMNGVKKKPQQKVCTVIGNCLDNSKSSYEVAQTLKGPLR